MTTVDSYNDQHDGEHGDDDEIRLIFQVFFDTYIDVTMCLNMLKYDVLLKVIPSVQIILSWIQLFLLNWDIPIKESIVDLWSSLWFGMLFV